MSDTNTLYITVSRVYDVLMAAEVITENRADQYKLSTAFEMVDSVCYAVNKHDNRNPIMVGDCFLIYDKEVKCLRWVCGNKRSLSITLDGKIGNDATRAFLATLHGQRIEFDKLVAISEIAEMLCTGYVGSPEFYAVRSIMVRTVATATARAEIAALKDEVARLKK